MFEIEKPLTFEDLPVKPPLVGKPRMSEDLQQTVALLVGWDKSTRRLVSVSPTGVLHVAQSPIKGVINIKPVITGVDWQGGDISTSEVMIRSISINTGVLWINVGVVAGIGIGYPLDAGEWVCFSINNLHGLYLHFTKVEDTAVIIYTK